MKIGDKIKVWWSTGTPTHPSNISTIIAILPYRGMFTQYYDCVLRLTTNTPRGWCEMAYNSINFKIDSQSP